MQINYINTCILSGCLASSATPLTFSMEDIHICISKCGTTEGTGGPDPPGKSQVIWVSIGNKQLDPPPLEKVGHPSPGKCWTPLEP